MNILFSYLAIFLIFGLLGSNHFRVFSGSWFMLVLLGFLNIAIIAMHEYASKFRQAALPQKPGLPSNTPGQHEPELLIARPEIDENEIISVWQGRHIRFFKAAFPGALPVSVWVRDRYGNIIMKTGIPVNGLIRCEYFSNGIHRAYSLIQFNSNEITDFPVIWYRASGNRYMDYILEGNRLSGTFNTYHANGNLKRSVRLKNGRADGIAKTYDENGAILLAADYISGRKDGSYCRYYPGGFVMETGSCVGGRLSGYVKKYYGSGVQESEKYYLNGVLMFSISYDFSGHFLGQTFTPEFRASAADDNEINSFKRLAQARDAPSQTGMYLYDPQSNQFPRIRAICSHRSGMVLKEFSCEEELLCFVLDKERFDAFAGSLAAPKAKPVLKHFNDKGRLVRFR